LYCSYPDVENDGVEQCDRRGVSETVAQIAAQRRGAVHRTEGKAQQIAPGHGLREQRRSDDGKHGKCKDHAPHGLEVRTAAAARQANRFPHPSAAITLEST
jgi:hypothetical protein